jgi:hypothetical protein
MMNRIKAHIRYEIPRPMFRAMCDQVLLHFVVYSNPENYAFGLGPERVILTIGSCWSRKDAQPARHIAMIRVAEVKGTVTTFCDHVFTEGSVPGLPPLKDDMDFGYCWKFFEQTPASSIPLRVGVHDHLR